MWALKIAGGSSCGGQSFTVEAVDCVYHQACASELRACLLLMGLRVCADVWCDDDAVLIAVVQEVGFSPGCQAPPDDRALCSHSIAQCAVSTSASFLMCWGKYIALYNSVCVLPCQAACCFCGCRTQFQVQAGVGSLVKWGCGVFGL